MTTGKVALITAGGSGMGVGAALAAELGGLGVTGSNQSTDDLKRLVDGAMDRRARIPMGRYGREAEVSSLIAWLASDEGGYVTGQNRRVDGGLTRAV